LKRDGQGKNRTTSELRRPDADGDHDEDMVNAGERVAEPGENTAVFALRNVRLH